ncbi:MAG: hypothetical protein IPH45_16365 [Bacteroidales bacterium]|nr:hypothetical protein [Bacteroidales bacterium]
MSGHLAVFKRYGSNIIDWVKPTAEEKWHAENLTHVDLTGAEISFHSISTVTLREIALFPLYLQVIP